MINIKRISTPFSYSSAVKAGNFLFLGLHRGFGNGFSEQINDTFNNLIKTLKKFSLNLENLVKVNVWFKDINDLPEMEKVFFNYFKKDSFPARMTSTTEFIDSDCLLMIEGTAYIEENE